MLEENKINQYYKVTPLLLGFYQLLELLNTPNTKVKKTEVKKDLKQITDTLSLVFQDYIPQACWGEAAHAEDCCSHIYSEIQDNIDQAAQYDPKNFMPKLENLFNKHWHVSGYGGDSWANIAHAYNSRHRLSKELWVHQVCTLAHNSGCFLDKGGVVSINITRYLGRMDQRKRGKSLFSGGVHLNIPSIVSRLNELDCDDIYLEEFGEYYPLSWGNKILSRITLNHNKENEE